ncbi:MAG: transglutaminase-like domain-containing protein [Sulfurovum sp.]|nr:transglutaminase-like domain-containing protein [Sulfurovum sp.]
MKSEKLKLLASVIMAIAFILFIYGVFKVLGIVGRTQVGTNEGVYTSYVTTSQEIQDKAKKLTLLCQSKLCKVQSLLNFASNIPYKTNTFQKKSPQKIIQENFGDCDDKSNMLISMLHALEIEAYFVLVPKHIFVIVALEDKHLSQTKGLWVNDKKYYILESTAKDSMVGFPLKYDLDEIDVIIEPFLNSKIKIHTLEYKL